MTNAEKEKRIIQAMIETNVQLEKATKKYNDSITCLKMDISENKEFGNDISANKSWIDYCNKDKERMNFLKSHMDKLQNMLADVSKQLL